VISSLAGHDAIDDLMCCAVATDGRKAEMTCIDQATRQRYRVPRPLCLMNDMWHVGSTECLR